MSSVWVMCVRARVMRRRRAAPSWFEVGTDEPLCQEQDWREQETYIVGLVGGDLDMEARRTPPTRTVGSRDQDDVGARRVSLRSCVE